MGNYDEDVTAYVNSAKWNTATKAVKLLRLRAESFRVLSDEPKAEAIDAAADELATLLGVEELSRKAVKG